MKDDLIKRNREFIKDTLRLEYDFGRTDQHRGVAPPPIQKPRDPQAPVTPLPGPSTFAGSIGEIVLKDAILRRESRRRYSDEPLSTAELSFLLFATQGVREIPHPAASLRTVPSAGARHSFETYLLAANVEGIDAGLYRYLPVEHALLFQGQVKEMAHRVTRACLGQRFVGQGAVTFVWATIPYRMEWRYGPLAHRVILMDVGHVCQNLYLACEAIGAGTCGVAAYDQQAMDDLVGVDGQDEFTVYLAPVGKV